jgi:hypothetical protein
MTAVARTQRPLPQKTQNPTPCRHCGSATFRRAHRLHRWDRLLSVTGLYPLRCAQCNRRCYRFRPQLPAAD